MMTKEERKYFRETAPLRKDITAPVLKLINALLDSLDAMENEHDALRARLAECDTVWDRYARAALTGMVAYKPDPGAVGLSVQQTVDVCRDLADAMMAARRK